jgi:hypothetical protein
MSDDKGPRCTSWLKKKVGQHANVRETVADLHCKCGETVKLFRARVERVLAFLQICDEVLVTTLCLESKAHEEAEFWKHLRRLYVNRSE